MKSTLLFLLSATFSFADASTPPTISFGSASITVDQSSGEVTIPVVVSGPPLSDFFGTSVQTKSADGTAAWPTDYDSSYGYLKFYSGETSKNLIIGLPTSPVFSGTRTFSVRLENGSDYNVGSPSTVTITITGQTVTVRAPVIETSTKYLSGRRVQVQITATDHLGKQTIKKLIIKPKLSSALAP